MGMGEGFVPSTYRVRTRSSLPFPMDPLRALQPAPSYSHAGGLRALAAKTSPFIIKIRSARQLSASLCSERKQNCWGLRPSRLGKNGPDVCAGVCGQRELLGVSIGKAFHWAGPRYSRHSPPRPAPPSGCPSLSIARWRGGGGTGTARRAPRRGGRASESGFTSSVLPMKRGWWERGKQREAARQPQAERKKSF